eukprot:GFYU01007547.1.p1 GENE.GFYU01007547.1~~GFYU01007547.1.p1  ORF type:complete len:790 (-),score=280.46 GFYU01007547.1:102-2471(-)
MPQQKPNFFGLPEPGLQKLTMENVEQYCLRPPSTAKYPVYIDLSNQHWDLSSIVGLNVFRPDALKELSLNFNKLEKIDEIMNMTSLKRLAVSNNLLTDATPIMNFSKLLHLDLSHNKLTELPPLPKNLLALNISNNNISGDFFALAGCRGLTYLNIANNNFSFDLQTFLLNASVFLELGNLGELDMSNNNNIHELFGYKHYMLYFAFRLYKFNGELVTPEMHPHHPDYWRQMAEKLIKEKQSLESSATQDQLEDEKGRPPATLDEVEELRHDHNGLKRYLKKMTKSRERAEQDVQAGENEIDQLHEQLRELTRGAWEPPRFEVQVRAKERRKTRSKSLFNAKKMAAGGNSQQLYHLNQFLEESKHASGHDASSKRSVRDALERQVVEEHNKCRCDPQGYIRILEDFKQYYDGKTIRIPGQTPLVTMEGVDAVDEAIDFLDTQEPLHPLMFSKALSLAAMDLVDDHGPKGLTGHEGTDGTDAGERCRRYGEFTEGWLGPSESCTYGQNTAQLIVIQLLIDDGEPSRGHRENIFSDDHSYCGISVGPHSDLDYMCVAVYAAGFRELKSIRQRPELDLKSLRDAIMDIQDDTVEVEFDSSYGVEPLSHPEHPIEVDDYAKVVLYAPPDVFVVASLGDDKTRTFVQKKDDRVVVEANFPEPGEYALKLFAKEGKQTASYESIGQYRVQAHRGNPDATFPEIFRAFNDKGVYLYGPKEKYLQSGVEYTFKLKCRGASKIAVVHDEKWTHLQRGKGGVFEGTVKFASPQQPNVGVFGEFGDDGKFMGLLQYECSD